MTLAEAITTKERLEVVREILGHDVEVPNRFKMLEQTENYLDIMIGYMRDIIMTNLDKKLQDEVTL